MLSLQNSGLEHIINPKLIDICFITCGSMIWPEAINVSGVFISNIHTAVKHIFIHKSYTLFTVYIMHLQSQKSDWAFNINTMINSINYWTHLPLEGRKRCPIPDEPLLVLSFVFFYYCLLLVLFVCLLFGGNSWDLEKIWLFPLSMKTIC